MVKIFNKIKDIYDRNLSKVKFYDKELRKDYAAKIAFISSVVTIISFFFTLSDYIKNICMILFILAMMCIFLYMWWSANHKDECNFVINNTRVEVVGDMI